MVVFSMGIKGIHYCEIVAESETMNAVRCLESLTRLIDCWHGNRKHVLWLTGDGASQPSPNYFLD